MSLFHIIQHPLTVRVDTQWILNCGQKYIKGCLHINVDRTGIRYCYMAQALNMVVNFEPFLRQNIYLFNIYRNLKLVMVLLVGDKLFSANEVVQLFTGLLDKFLQVDGLGRHRSCELMTVMAVWTHCLQILVLLMNIRLFAITQQLTVVKNS